MIICGQSGDHFEEIKKVLKLLYPLTAEPIDAKTLRVLINEDYQTAMTHHIRLSRKSISARNSKQAAYLDSINKHDITFAVGPAGTGKTYLAVSKAIEYFEKGEVQRLIFVRPAVEAGEKLGFLPGDLVEKVLPYLRPIYDALYEMIGFKETQKLIQTDIIEILPLAFMRGRTLNESFIILDEAQNTTIMQMKMFLTRMGFGSKTVITGDITQVDLPKGIDSGLTHAIQLFGHFPDISIHTFTSREVVRHPLVSKIVDCYDNEIERNKK
ncbi:PhoH family protein [Legionella pneumophila subsp. fraseri]|nr:PhoH family protein [Legionella pneumophila]MDW8878896.1 PhoH family protein [Legionella pneumophila subsp. fraseri]MDW8961375.1 PhoH family protein [Legionella pneumophila subsp. fraseri]MDW9037058.1 PhoH family protein [Legionella pneumophila subsp. fraseri]MDW9038894.1 PhoH family protein [Legionella pneumophila subsp. fraseri]MDW9041742.1 PhoH family protein [Legionella pneumophila subsp. fraseri]